MQLQMQEQFLFIRHHLMYSTIHSMRQTDLVLKMRVTFTEDLQILQRMFLKRESQHLRVVWQHLQLVQVQQQLHTLFRILHLQVTTL